jgi:polysaccharide pyruvyl transferase WcaK-like protein
MMRQPSRQIALQTPDLAGNLAAAIQDEMMTRTSAESGELPARPDLPARQTSSEVPEACPRIALLTPYLGGNLGDAAIQDSMIANLRLRLPGTRLAGISLNCDNFLERHATSAFPLCGTNRRFYGMARGRMGERAGEEEKPARAPRRIAGAASQIKAVLRRVPGLRRGLRAVRATLVVPAQELRHWFNGYRFLRTQDLLIVSGGGQLDQEWGGPWAHPYALFKWACLARLARVPCAFASVGASQLRSALSRRFISAALGLARYRSFRDRRSRGIAAALLRRAAADPVVPDLAFSLPAGALPAAAGLRQVAQGRSIVAISPIVFGRPGNWPRQNRALHERYLDEVARLISELLRRDYCLAMVCSSLGDDESVIPELLERCGEAGIRYGRQILRPSLSTWRDLVAILRDCDVLVASRLHSTILGFVTGTPTVAISFDPKVDWVMEDLGQTDYLLHIHEFTAENVIQALGRLDGCRHAVRTQIAAYRQQILSASALQYENLAALARESCAGRR